LAEKRKMKFSKGRKEMRGIATCQKLRLSDRKLTIIITKRIFGSQWINSTLEHSSTVSGLAGV
jgi:hypothetical protein